MKYDFLSYVGAESRASVAGRDAGDAPQNSRRTRKESAREGVLARMQAKSRPLFLLSILMLALVTAACSLSSRGKFVCSASSSACVDAISGDYTGTFSGAASGSWTATFSKTGAATGTAKLGDQAIALTGSSDATGKLVFGSGASGIEFSGELFDDGSVSGTWVKGSSTGTFEGKRLAGAPIQPQPSDGGGTSDFTPDSGGGGPTAFACTASEAACLNAMAGNYNGTYSGAAAGTWKATIATNGAITGSAIIPGGGTLTLTGQADPKGLLVFGNTSKGAQFSGTLYTDGTVTGSWAMSSAQGAFLGVRAEGPLTMP